MSRLAQAGRSSRSPDLFAGDKDGRQAAMFVYFCGVPRIILLANGTCTVLPEGDRKSDSLSVG